MKSSDLQETQFKKRNYMDQRHI